MQTVSLCRTEAAFAAILVLGVVISTLLAVWATSAEGEANRQRDASNEAKQDALEAKQAALDARAEAVKQRDEARLTAYVAGMNLASRAWEENNVPRARELLEEVPKSAAGRDLRGFEWYYLSRVCNSEMRTLEGHDHFVLSVAFSPDGQRLASGSADRTVKIWESATGKELFSLKGDALWVHTVKIWDSARHKELSSFKFKAGAISPDGQYVASATNYFEVTVWQSATGKELFSFKRHGGEVLSLAFSPDGQPLASGCAEDGTIKIWDSATGKELLSLKGHSDSVRSLAFSPDGQRLASGSDDKTVKLWDSTTGKELISLKDPGSRFPYVAFSPDGQRLASVHRGGLINLWELSVSPEIHRRRAANQLVARLFQQKGLRADVLEQLRTARGMSQTRRQEALAAAQTYPENPSALNNLAWELVKLPGRAMSDYRKAVRYSEATCQLTPKNGLYMTTLGMAYYRSGNYLKALETLQKPEKIHQVESKVSHAADLAFLAMTQQRLGHEKEARAYLQQLRERMKDPRLAEHAEGQRFLREVETLLAKPTTTGSK